MSPEVCVLHPDGCQAIRMTDDEVEARIERGGGDMVPKPQTAFPGITYGRKPSSAAADAYIAAAEALDAARLREAAAFPHPKPRLQGAGRGPRRRSPHRSRHLRAGRGPRSHPYRGAMRCPRCSSGSYRRYKSPVEMNGLLLRRHLCLTCRTVFFSAQRVVKPAAAERLISRTATPPIQRTPFSSRMHAPAATSETEGLASRATTVTTDSSIPGASSTRSSTGKSPASTSPLLTSASRT